MSQPQAHSAAGKIMSMKNSNDTIGNRTHDLLACSAEPQPTAPSRAPEVSGTLHKLSALIPRKYSRHPQQQQAPESVWIIWRIETVLTHAVNQKRFRGHSHLNLGTLPTELLRVSLKRLLTFKRTLYHGKS